MKLRTISVVMVIGFLVSSVPVMGAEIGGNQDLDYILGREMTEEERREALELTEYYNSLQTELPKEEPVERLGYSEELLRASAIPSKYDARTEKVITEVKNQHPYGTCWAFSAINSMEASALKQGILDQNNADLSELHSIYYTYFPVTDRLGGTTGDSTEYLLGGTEYLFRGGNVNYFYHRLANWQGAAPEAAAPYDKAGEPLPDTVESAYGQNVVHLKGAYGYHVSDTASIKQAVMDYGAACISYNSSWQYYNPDTAAQYCGEDNVYADHAVSIVGWDDNYKKENFKETPLRDGAWLIKNSWGENWGDKGYFWLSYEDRSIGGSVYVLQSESADAYDNNYQYDGTILDNRQYASYVNSLKIANVFEAQANPGGKEELEAIGFYTGSANINYGVQIYVNLKDKSNPESGQAALATPITGTAGPMGYYTVPLEQKIRLGQGQSFAVVVSMENSSQVQFVVEASGTSNGILKSQAKAEENQSFVNLYGSWQDWGKSYGNVRVKAFTKNLSADERPEATPTPTPTPEPVPAPTAVPAPMPTPTAIPVSKDFPFKDVAVNPGSWKYESVKYVYKNGIMNGITNSDGSIDTFDPDSSLTRGMFATVLYRMAGSPQVAFERRFSDVVPNRYYSNAVIWAYQKGIVSGYADGNFGVFDPITREQIAKMLKIYADLKGYDTNIRADLKGFPDVDDISGWAADYIKWAVGSGMINGRRDSDGIFYLKPRGEATRAECAAMLMRFIQRYGEINI